MKGRMLTLSVAVLIGAAAIGSATAESVFETSGRITYLTFFGNGGPRSGETIVGSIDASGRDCGYQDRFTARIGYPLTDATLKSYVRMHAALLRSYVRQRAIIIQYRCTSNLPEVEGIR
jgi:hypothetical protein